MAWNPSPEVAVARDAARKLGANRCVVIFIKDENFGMASYGETKKLCEWTKGMGDALFEEARRYIDLHD